MNKRISWFGKSKSVDIVHEKLAQVSEQLLLFWFVYEFCMHYCTPENEPAENITKT